MALKTHYLVQLLRKLPLGRSAFSCQRLSEEESNLLEHFRALPERDRIALRLLCSAIHRTSTS
ncbi:hypothetical protein [Pseudomonas xantholysinigenes]|jgi:hypothetical protein|uniref:Uncharacterized protein n=1 Tax=Pseudomonas xantholysinigenes TaxID=2745490 RepID=A0A9E6PUK9_9PSED|nr:hypothetical protein [Pseudomonas xantholysinigenes]QXI36761.1 hypothetical protein HU772_015535 [Pseudomonas xantholysinigenes]